MRAGREASAPPPVHDQGRRARPKDGLGHGQEGGRYVQEDLRQSRALGRMQKGRNNFIMKIKNYELVGSLEVLKVGNNR